MRSFGFSAHKIEPSGKDQSISHTGSRFFDGSTRRSQASSFLFARGLAVRLIKPRTILGHAGTGSKAFSTPHSRDCKTVEES